MALRENAVNDKYILISVHIHTSHVIGKHKTWSLIDCTRQTAFPVKKGTSIKITQYPWLRLQATKTKKQWQQKPETL